MVFTSVRLKVFAILSAECSPPDLYHILAGIKCAGIDARLNEIGEAIQEVMESYEVGDTSLFIVHYFHCFTILHRVVTKTPN